MISIKQSGKFANTESFLKRVLNSDHIPMLHRYGREGVAALSAATPVSSGLTASSWSYEITHSKNKYTIVFKNSHTTNEGTPIAILIQYGHGTGTGGYVQGLDFINPALRPIFERMSEEIWREVSK